LTKNASQASRKEKLYKMNIFVFLLAQVFFFLKRKSVKKALPKKHFKK